MSKKKFTPPQTPGWQLLHDAVQKAATVKGRTLFHELEIQLRARIKESIPEEDHAAMCNLVFDYGIRTGFQQASSTTAFLLEQIGATAVRAKLKGNPYFLRDGTSIVQKKIVKKKAKKTS